MKHPKPPPTQRDVADICFKTRAERVARKRDIEDQMRSCEEQLQTLRQELAVADIELQKVESIAAAWEKFLLEFPDKVDVVPEPAAEGAANSRDFDVESVLDSSNDNHMYDQY